MKNSKFLLKRFVGKGGVIGQIAELYVDDEEKSTKFLLELRHRLKANKRFYIEIWGKELIGDLERFQ